jgi:hypothetical protein
VNLWEEALALYETLARLSWDSTHEREYWRRVNELAHRALARANRRFTKGLYR